VIKHKHVINVLKNQLQHNNYQIKYDYLSVSERATVHRIAEKFGLKHTNRG
jgi:DnaJ-domain-containing protein 1